MGKRYASETSIYRGHLVRFCEGNGLDIGSAGDPIHPESVTIELPEGAGGHMDCGIHPANFRGDARDLRWFHDGVLDYIYSSHVLEDFEDTTAVLREWLRVIRPGGRLVLLLPDQQRYLADCRKTGQMPNQAHKNAAFSMTYVVDCLLKIGGYEVEHAIPELGPYSFALVIRKL